MADLSPLTIALIALVIAGTWAIVELALTFRKTRKTIDELSGTVNDTLAEVRPVITKLDGMADELGPASKQIEPLLTKAQTSVDALSLDLLRVDGILGDVSTVTGTASNATNAVTNVVDSAANAATGLIGRISGHGTSSAKLIAGSKPGVRAKSAHPAVERADSQEPVEPVASQPAASAAKATDGGYFTYPSGADAQDESSK